MYDWLNAYALGIHGNPMATAAMCTITLIDNLDYLFMQLAHNDSCCRAVQSSTCLQIKGN